MLGDPQNLTTNPSDLPPVPPAQPAGLPLAPREIWTLRDLLLFACAIPFAYVVADLLVLMGYVVLRPFLGWRETAESVQKSTLFLLTLQFIFYAFMMGLLFVASKARHHQLFWRSLGWRKPTERQVAGWIAGGGALAVLAGLALSIRPDTRPFPLEGMFNSRPAALGISVFAIGIAPVVEEVVFRGLLFAICERIAGLYFAVVATAVLFATLHIPEYWPAWNHIVIIFLVGMVFSLARARSGALTPSVFLHIGYNCLMIIGFFVSS